MLFSCLRLSLPALVFAMGLLTGCAGAKMPALTEKDRLDEMERSFLERSAQLGGGILFTPEIREWTRPALTSWDPLRRLVVYPRWEDLPNGDRTLFAAWVGDDLEAKRLFTWTYRWMFVSRELARAVADVNGAPQPPAEAERSANDLAISFLKGEPGAPKKLDALQKTLRRTLARMPRKPADADAAFERACGDGSFDFAGCVPGQLRYAYESLALRDELDFDLQLEAVKRRRAEAKASAASAEAQSRAASSMP